jgi:hypothetical protein
MEHDTEASSNSLDQYSGLQIGRCVNKLLEIATDFRCELARLFWTAFLGKQPLNACLVQICPSLIDGGPRKAKIQGCLRDRTAIDINRANRLVFELNHIMGIEEVVFGEQGVANFFRVAVQGAGGAQRLDFFRVGRHKLQECKVKYTAYCVHLFDMARKNYRQMQKISPYKRMILHLSQRYNIRISAQFNLHIRLNFLYSASLEIPD